MTDLISRTDLLAALEDLKKVRGKLYQNDYSYAIENAPRVEASGNAWISDRDPEKPIETFVKVQKGDETRIMIAKYKPSGFYNAGLNKWSVEQVVGLYAGCKVVAWIDPPKE